ncbi:MAG TPA: GntR family transcriptional regulator [Blastocatellia bacterium]|nr:GntR family transcriptional regulator [Blastocatellia bacterium]
MRIWLSKSSEVPLREQLATQILLGIVSNDLKPGQKLPSTRELARRYDIHSNTVSAAFQDLEKRGWVEFRKGSGVYVRELSTDVATDPKLELDQLISTLLQVARERGHSLGEIQARVKRWLETQPPDHFLVIEPDEEMRSILIAEIKQATSFRVAGVGIEECSRPEVLAGAAAVAMYGQAEGVRAALPPDASCLLLRLRSVPGSIAGQERPSADSLVTVVSRWPDFLKWARTILVAAALDPDAMSFRDAREPGWQKGLKSSAMVITDALTATQLPAGCRTRVFRIIADSSLDELRNFKEFLTTPLV